jgi:hypothetical protein
VTSNSKGRSGKKPKYEIQDIGGPGLTAEDRSMERVLDFIVRGSLDDVTLQEGSDTDKINQPLPGDPVVVPGTVSTDDHAGVISDAQNRTESNKEPGSRKSLDHLFSRSGQLARKSPVDATDAQTDDLRQIIEPAQPLRPSAPARQNLHTEPVERANESEEARPTFLLHEAILPEPDLLPENLIVNTPLPIAGNIAELSSGRASPTISDETASFEAFKDRFGKLIKNRSLKLCEVIFDHTLAVGKSEYFTTTAELTKVVGVHQRQCYNLLGRLEALGFINRTPVEENSRLLGIILSINLNPFK